MILGKHNLVPIKPYEKNNYAWECQIMLEESKKLDLFAISNLLA